MGAEGSHLGAEVRMNEQEQLAAYRAMQAAIETEYTRTAERMAALKAQGKEKTATYRQLFARKLTLSELLSWYRTYGLIQKGETEV